MSAGGESGGGHTSSGDHNPGVDNPGVESPASGGGTTTVTAVEDLRMEIPVQRPRRAENFVALCFLVSVAGAIGLAIIYSLGGQTQAEGALLGASL
ncbi:MAG TPA: hypothetical protein VG476_14230, partial [Acidimicrobiales bacterium]|nr:hypothetical protein [Acidimicrobiales bacterium]